MQELFSKVNSEKRHLYGENGILGHRRAISTTVPSKSPNISGHRRTNSNTSSDFKAIISASPTLTKQINSPVEVLQKPQKRFFLFLNEAFEYFTDNTLPKRFRRAEDEISEEIQKVARKITSLQESQMKMIGERSDLKLKIQEEIEKKKKSDIFLNVLKKNTNEFEISLKNIQEQVRIEKGLTCELINQIEGKKKERNVYASLQILTNEDFTHKMVGKNNYSEKTQHFPLTPSLKQFESKSGNISPI